MAQSYSDIVENSVRTGGRDTLSIKPTRFLNTEELSKLEQPPAPKEASFQLWTDEHSALSRERRETRENSKKGHVVAEVEDFDLKTHLQNVANENEKSKSKWKFW